MLATVKEILHMVTPGWAVAAFNVHNLDDARAVVEAAEELNSPVILMVSQSALEYAGLSFAARICRTAAEEVRIPVAVQLDHGRSVELALACMHHGFTAVMFDGSHLPLEENIAQTRQVVKAAARFGVSVEGELGVIGGKEDELAVADQESNLTDPQEAQRFVEATGIDVFAPAVGTAHGFYTRPPRINLERVRALWAQVKVPLALHGSSGLSTVVLKQLIAEGIAKVNIGTDLKAAYTASLRGFLTELPEEHEPRKVFAFAREQMKNLVRERLGLLGSVDKAR